MTRVELRDGAATDLERIDEWLSQNERANPAQVRERIGAAIKFLERHGDKGRPSETAPLREWSVRGAPYVLVYEVEDDVIWIVAVFHTSQNR